MQKWLDLLTPSAAAVAILIAIGLAIQAIRQGRQIKRLEQRVTDDDGAAARVSLDRLQSLTRRAGKVRTDRAGGDGGGRLPLGTLAAMVSILAVLGATTWYVFFRDGDTDTTAGTTATQQSGTKTKPTPVDQVRTSPSENPKALTPSKGAFTILVLNGTFTPGAAGSGVVPVVQRFGYNTAPADNSPERNFKESVVVYLEGKFDVADNVAKDLGITQLRPQDGVTLNQSLSDVDAVVIVGQDLADKYRP